MDRRDFDVFHQVQDRDLLVGKPDTPDQALWRDTHIA